jgi:hypothetical protein
MDRTKDIMLSIAGKVDEALNTGAKRCGFVVLVFPFDQPEGQRTNYVSNCDRKDMLTALKEVTARFEGRTITTETKQ